MTRVHDLAELKSLKPEEFVVTDYHHKPLTVVSDYETALRQSHRLSDQMLDCIWLVHQPTGTAFLMTPSQ